MPVAYPPQAVELCVFLSNVVVWLLFQESPDAGRHMTSLALCRLSSFCLVRFSFRCASGYRPLVFVAFLFLPALSLCSLSFSLSLSFEVLSMKTGITQDN